MTTEQDFNDALDLHPNDWQTRLVFADWLDERDDPRAEGYRALAACRVYPATTASQSTWGGTNHPAMGDPDWVMANRSCLLPTDWFLLLPFDPKLDWQDTNRPIWKRKKKRRESEDGAALAFAKLPAARRAQLLAQGAAA